MNEMLSILLFGTQMATGGAQKVLLDQARWFHERGHKVTAAFFYDKDGFYKKWQDACAFPILNLYAFNKDAGLLNGLFLIRGLWRLWKLIRREKFDAIETFTHDSNMLVMPLAWLAQAPARIATHHGAIEGFPRWREIIHAWMINHNLAQTLVAVSEMTRQLAIKEGVQAERIMVIQNGITPVAIEDINRLDVRKDLGIEESALVLLSVGRLVYQKAHEILIVAMPIILKKFPNTKVIICGEGVLRPQLEGQIKSLGLSDSIKLPGKFDSVAKFLAAADIFVLPSRWEGLPIALLEAMSAGLPVVASKVEGVDEVVLQDENGLLVPVEDPSALANAILQLLTNIPLMRKMGSAAKIRVLDNYSEDKMCEKYLHIMKHYNNTQQNKG